MEECGVGGDGRWSRFHLIMLVMRYVDENVVEICQTDAIGHNELLPIYAASISSLTCFYSLFNYAILFYSINIKQYYSFFKFNFNF